MFKNIITCPHTHTHTHTLKQFLIDSDVLYCSASIATRIRSLLLPGLSVTVDVAADVVPSLLGGCTFDVLDASPSPVAVADPDDDSSSPAATTDGRRFLR